MLAFGEDGFDLGSFDEQWSLVVVVLNEQLFDMEHLVTQRCGEFEFCRLGCAHHVGLEHADQDLGVDEGVGCVEGVGGVFG